MTPSVSPVLAALLVVFAVLTAGSILRLARLHRHPERNAQSRRGSLLSWWILFLLLAAAVAFGALGICLLLTIASCLALQEYFRLVDPGRADRVSRVTLYALAAVTYGAIYFGRGPLALLLLPLAALLAVSIPRIVRGAVDGFVGRTGALVIGVLLLVSGPAHAALLATLPGTTPLGASGAGWFIFLILLTEINDISQALVGRKVGRRRITPEVSPNKTLEGCLGGLAVTVVLAVVAAPLLTPLAGESITEFSLWPLAAGIVISVSGVLGDLTMSAIKRDLGVKDGSDRLPGMGGVLDRIDSLTFAAPAFYWLIESAGHG